MYLPMWLILVALAVILISRRDAASAFAESLKGIGCLLAVVIVALSFFGFLYLASRREYLWAMVVGVPFGIWGLRELRRDSGTIRLSLRPRISAHLWFTKKIADPTRLRRSRERFARAIQLPQRIHELHEETRHYSSWLRDPHNCEWCTPGVTPEHFPVARWSDDEKRRFPESKPKSEDKFFLFRTKDNEGHLLDCLVYESDESRFQNDVWVADIYLDSVLVLKISYHGTDNVFGGIGEFHIIEAFKPGSWLVFVYDFAQTAKDHAKQKHDAFEAKFKADQRAETQRKFSA